MGQVCHCQDITQQKTDIFYQFLKETFYTERRFPELGRYFDNSEGKIRQQKLGNSMKCMAALPVDWLKVDLDDHHVSIMSKKIF